jgi:hypothetical protein
MREQEMRQRVERFLQTRLRKMLMPATLGLGLAVAGCNSDGLNTSDDGGSTANKDTGSQQSDVVPPTPMYMAQMPDSGAAMLYMAQLPDSGVAVRYMAQLPADAAPDTTGIIVALYMAQLPVPRS